MFAALLSLLTLASATPALSAYPAVTNERLAAAASDDGWLMYRRSYDAHGFAPFDEITPANVATLKTAFTYDTHLPQGHESPPLVNGNTLFVTAPLDEVIALDATTGAVRWTYQPKIDPKALRAVCCDVVNRGVALYGTNVYIGTIDDRLIALDAATGKVVWERAVLPPGEGDHAITGAPLIVNGMVITGVAGGEYGARGLIAAYNATTGAPVWQRWTVPKPGEPGGDTWPDGAYKRSGGDTWITGSYDPETKTLFWGTGNPSPWFGALRPGKNLFSDSVLALDPATGAMRWYYQYTPNDSWDYDGVNELILADVPVNGAPVPALLHADRNGYFFAIDRRSGKLIYAKPFAKTTSISGYSADGNAIVNPAAYPVVGKTVFACPSSAGAKNWYPAAFSPQTKLVYVPTLHLCAKVTGTGNIHERFGYFGEVSETVAEPGADGFGELQALDIASGTQRWSVPSKFPWTGGVVATAGGLVFSGNASGDFFALDASSGKELWKAHLSSGVLGVPVSYRVAGKQYVAVYCGYGGGLAAFGGPAAALTAKIPRGGRLYVFTLPTSSASP